MKFPVRLPECKTYWYVVFSTPNITGARFIRVSRPFWKKVGLDGDTMRTIRLEIACSLTATGFEDVVITFFSRVPFWVTSDERKTNSAPVRKVSSGSVRPVEADGHRGA